MSPQTSPTALPAGLTLRTVERFDELDARTFHAIAKLRQEVFVLEQDCVYLDLDGRDLEPGTVQMWAEGAAGEIATSVRILDEHATEPGLLSIGRVVTAPAWRGRGAAAALMRHAIARCGDASILIHAQAHLTGWYARFGFQSVGDEYLEDDIPHQEMRIR
ncbi:GNAT family N-acetyltransferase [Leucobacter salsicius]|uniref:GNAT family N-acetyltransferase n=1 Tax=Leucobacter salsicius TaxID=664638 RepID=UPI000348B29A|nr:GNAT family N-acetyltransferase [Leucobacter salsicius]